LYVIISDRHYVVADTVYSKSNINLKDGFTLGIVGDSWTCNRKIDTSLNASLSRNGIDNKIISFCLSGKKSGEIYDDFITENSNNFNSEDLLEDDSIDAILIVAGVNDEIGHIGSDYYVQNYKNIISTINSKGKFAYILELPEVGLEEPENFLSSIKHGLYKVIFDEGKTDITQNYRDELYYALSETNLSYVIIPFSPFIDDYYKNINLYANPSHLDAEGYTLLGEYIGDYISQTINE
jgi:hypothetical protein